MNTLQNLHTHTNFDDGKNTAEEMIESAISKGFGGIGFSGHSYTGYSAEYTMSPDGTKAFQSEIKSLKEKYKGIIDVFLGLEADMYSDFDLSEYDYSIGALHCLRINGEDVGFDRSAEVVRSIIDTHFAGNGMAFAKEYYEQLSHLPEHGKFDIIAHFDIITKNIEKERFFDIGNEEYLKYAFDALDAMRGKIPLFEVNTGAISRGYRTSPYPAKNILKRMKEWGFGAVISSDCHNAEYLDCAFGEARYLLVECGFKEKYILTPSGFISVAL